MSPEIKCGDFILKLELDEPSGKLKEKAERELRETPENVEKGLKELRKLLEVETDLYIPIEDDKWLIAFLRPCKFYPESARRLIRHHYTIKQKYNAISQILSPLTLKSVFDANLTSIFPNRNQDGCRIVITHGGERWNHKDIPFDKVFASGILCNNFLQLEPSTQINGIIFIFDTMGLSFRQALQYTPYNAKRCLDYIQDSAPIRVKGFHIVNQPKIFEPIFAAIKPFFNDKFRSRIMMHGTNFKSLHQYISPDCLPECYGGTLKTDLVYGRETYSLLSHYEDYFQKALKYGFKKDL